MAAVPYPFFEPVHPPRVFQVVAHPGDSRQAPGNTRPALERCIEDGLEWAAVDVRSTLDHHLVLALPSHTGTTSDPLPPVESLTLRELRRLDLGTRFAPRYRGERVLTLKECLALARGRINLRLDPRNVDARRLVREIVRADMTSQVLVGGDSETLERIDAESRGSLALLALWQPDLDRRMGNAAPAIAAVELPAEAVDPARCRAFHERGIRVFANHKGTRDTAEAWDRSLAAGVDAVQTELPEELLGRALRKRLPQWPVRFSLHRGASRYAPENTIPAFEKAVRMGADYVEFDVRTSRDGQFYLLHDRTLDACTDGRGPIDSNDSTVLDALSAGIQFGAPYASVRLPRFEAFLGAVGSQVDLYFDAKAITPEALAALLSRHQLEARTVVYQSADYLAQLKTLAPGVRVMPPLRSGAALESLASTLKPYAVDVPWELLSRDLIARCHALGIQVFSDALDRHERIDDFQRAIDQGIDVIQTDHPLKLFRALELRAASGATSSRR